MRLLLKKFGLDKEVYKNYCFVFNFFFILKILEKVVVNCFDEYLDKNLLRDFL